MPTRLGPDVDYPVLGEPIAVEFVNTLYISPNGSFDFLGDIDLARGWFDSIGSPSSLRPMDVDEAARRALVELRASVAELFDARATGLLPPDAALDVVNTAANGSRVRRQLEWTDHGGPFVRDHHDLDRAAGAAALLAREAMAMVADTTGGPVLVCDRPACSMRYLQHHRRRRYCNPACANADRQARHQRRHRN